MWTLYGEEEDWRVFYGLIFFRARDREYRRKEKVKMTAAKLAGVYVDTTTQEKLVQDDDVIFSREDYKSLQKYKIPYDDISDEEL